MLNYLFIGEHIKNWRSRYFVLRDDGTLVGFKAKPDPQMATQTSTQPLNNFTVRGCQIMSVDRPKPYTFVIRGLQWTTVIERTFHVETEQDREDWVAAIRFVINLLSFKILIGFYIVYDICTTIFYIVYDIYTTCFFVFLQICSK